MILLSPFKGFVPYPEEKFMLKTLSPPPCLYGVEVGTDGVAAAVLGNLNTRQPEKSPTRRAAASIMQNKLLYAFFISYYPSNNYKCSVYAALSVCFAMRPIFFTAARGALIRNFDIFWQYSPSFKKAAVNALQIYH